MRPLCPVLWAVLAMAGACTQGDGGGTPFGGGGTVGPDGDTAGSGDGGAGEESGSGDDGAPRLDVATSKFDVSSDPDGADQGCKRVDFLFIVDNSPSMEDEQASLIASFPDFIATIEERLEVANDYHVMVTDVDPWMYQPCEDSCPNPLPKCIDLPGFECGVIPECEDEFGAGIVETRGENSRNRSCDFVGGNRYMTTAEPDLVASFTCAAQVGTGSMYQPEQPMDALMGAVSEEINLPGGCNAGFLRHDAILVVTFLTDEDDGEGDSTLDPTAWKQAVVDAKYGDETAVVMLGLFGDQDLPNPVCPPYNPYQVDGAQPSPRLREFLDLWGDQGLFGSICADNYDPFFQEAVELIDSTCDGFVPPTG